MRLGPQTVKGVRRAGVGRIEEHHGHPWALQLGSPKVGFGRYRTRALNSGIGTLRLSIAS